MGEGSGCGGEDVDGAREEEGALGVIGRQWRREGFDFGAPALSLQV